ncbi:MAG: type II secretion system minor pseudopilin GspK [Ferrovum sp.]|nr:type II secretion system minor pseudopilin GspK [Ferrovum sp.]
MSHRTKLNARQDGAALISAMFLMALTVTIISGLLSQEQVRLRAVQNERESDQAHWIGGGAIQWARLILREDLIQTGAVDHLNEVWAIPIPKTPLDVMVKPSGQNVEVTQPTDWIAGRIVDANSRFNLTDLIDVNAVMGDQGWVGATGINPEGVAIFGRILGAAGFAPDDALLVAQYMLQSRGPFDQTNPDPGLPLVSVGDLKKILPDSSDEGMLQLEQWVEILPRPTALNVNTVAPDLLAAVLGVDVGLSNQIVSDREQGYFTDVASMQSRIRSRVPQLPTLSDQHFNVKSDYFYVLEQMHEGRVTVYQSALIARHLMPRTITQVLWVHSGWPAGLTVQ